MKTEELKALGLTDEQANKVFALNGIDVNREKLRADGLQDQLNTAQDRLKTFEGVDVKDLQGQIAQLSKDLNDQADAHKKELAERDFSAKLDAAIQAKRGRSGKAIRAMLDLDALRASKNQDGDISAALDTLAKDSAYLFETAAPPPYAAGTGAKPLPITRDSFRKMTYQQRLELKRSDPNTYDAMKE
ncbi:MAG: phage scaffolding protein [Gemmiger sp.]